MPPKLQTPDSKKEEFRKYLEKSGVVDALTKVLVGLYEESDKPPNAVDYVKRFMGAPTGIDVDALRAENEELKKKNAELIKTVEELNKRVRNPNHGMSIKLTYTFAVTAHDRGGRGGSLTSCPRLKAAALLVAGKRSRIY
ncbi:c-Myc-binding [Phytophthora citrophthora]|uniref:c-Myc-binding n=1 Tax=Phytophthora citrophthora TaxID=4793 RepID=A0AAD9GSY0_9STRA|nr:c-Myc-binding [Phytophthora citrophthora]